MFHQFGLFDKENTATVTLKRYGRHMAPHFLAQVPPERKSIVWICR
jgi:hypothetical protein